MSNVGWFHLFVVVFVSSLTFCIGYWLGKRSVTNKLYNIIEPAFREGWEKQRVEHERRMQETEASIKRGARVTDHRYEP
jgi:hypothetical protein